MTDTATIPDLFGFETYYGLRLSDIGDDGEVVILGHHHDEPRRVVAALNRHARESWGMVNLVDDHSVEHGELADSMVETYATAQCGESCPDESCANCAAVRSGSRAWWIEWNKPTDAPYAFPVTVWAP